nr:hypothetical protein [Actinomycetota bacterium]
MTSSRERPRAARDPGNPDPSARAGLPVLTGLDALAGGALLLVAVVGWASLVLANVGKHSLPAVVAASVAGLMAVVLLCWTARQKVRWRADVPGVVLGLGCAAVAAALTFPGFSYGVADKDPGGYVSHAVEIARTHSYAFTDDALAAHLPVQLITPGARFGGIWVRDQTAGTIVPQFYHLWPALLATAYDAGGLDGIRYIVPVAGVLAVLCMTALLRRAGNAVGGKAAGIFAAGTGGLLLATNMLEVWQSRFPTTEVLAEALYLGALLGVVVALQSRWRPAAGLAGLLVGVGWLNRADALLVVLLSLGIGAALFATRRWDSRASWFAAGLALVVPHALLQAYHLAALYSEVNGIPSLRRLGEVVGALLVVAVVLRYVLGPVTRGTVRLMEGARSQRGLGVAVTALFFGLIALGFLRPILFGADYFDYNNVHIRSYDEAIMRRLSWFFTLPGFALMGLGIAVVALRRWRAPLWAAILPTLILFPVYGFSARNSTRLLWWTRRYVPTVMPGIVILMALTLAFAFVWRFRGRAPLRLAALMSVGALVWVYVSQSLPLRHHDEWGGSFGVTSRLVAESGPKHGIYFWNPDEPCCLGPMALFATPVWLQGGQLSVLLPRRTDFRD